MLEMVDSVTAVMQSVTEREEVRKATERIEVRESGLAMQAFWMVESVSLMPKMFLVESVPVVDAMARAEAVIRVGHRELYTSRRVRFQWFGLFETVAKLAAYHVASHQLLVSTHADRTNETRFAWLVTEFLAQATDQHID